MFLARTGLAVTPGTPGTTSSTRRRWEILSINLSLENPRKLPATKAQHAASVLPTPTIPQFSQGGRQGKVGESEEGGGRAGCNLGNMVGCEVVLACR